jgi:Ni/Fe-hydrogenase 1 B-type cytochrome subunit
MTEATQIHGALDSHGEKGARLESVYVYEAPVRLWHWVNAAAIVVLATTGYFIASPPPSTPGEASSQFLMGYIRFAHFSAGYVLAVALLMRAYWAIVGNDHARQIFYLPVWDRKWLWGVLHEMRWYAFLAKAPKKYIGHNPLGHTFMHLFMLNLLFLVVTGFALYSEGAGRDSWQYALFGWVFTIWPNSQDVHTWHHLAMWGVILFVIIHIYTAVREDIVSRQSMISSIISGERVFRDEADK